jgi:hypothetical protein
MLALKKPQAASAMMMISSRFTKMMSVRLSYLSASWPLVAENSRKGRMNSAPITSPAMAGGSQLICSW